MLSISHEYDKRRLLVAFATVDNLTLIFEPTNLFFFFCKRAISLKWQMMITLMCSPFDTKETGNLSLQKLCQSIIAYFTLFYFSLLSSSSVSARAFKFNDFYKYIACTAADKFTRATKVYCFICWKRLLRGIFEMEFYACVDSRFGCCVIGN